LFRWGLSSLNSAILRRVTERSWVGEDVIATSEALTRAFQSSLQDEYLHVDATEAIHDTCHQWGFRPAYSRTNEVLNEAVLRLCDSRNWVGAWEAARGPRSSPSSRTMSVEVREAIDLDDCQYVKQELNISCDKSALQLALDSKSDNVTAFIAARAGTWASLDILKHGRADALTILVCNYSHWEDLFLSDKSKRDYNQLDDRLYRALPHEDCGRLPCCLPMPRLDGQQIVLRILSCFAIHQHDIRLLEWLRRRGLTFEAVLVESEGDEIWHVSLIADGREGKFPVAQNDHEKRMSLPSLLSVAAQRNDLAMMKYFLRQKPTNKYSNELLRAIQTGSELATVELLLEQESSGSAGHRPQYGSAALKMAIRNKD
jgi:hypothetical protein